MEPLNALGVAKHATLLLTFGETFEFISTTTTKAL